MSSVCPEILSMLAHDLRAPLLSIQQSCSMFSDGLLGEVTGDQQETIDLIQANAATLDGMVRDFLDIVRNVEGASAPRMTQVSLASLIGAVAIRMRPNLHLAEVALEIDKPERLQQIWADGDQIQRVVTNLLSNAIRYSPQGGTITITVSDHDTTQRVAVSDQGPGIPAEELPAIFGRFWQGEQVAGKVSGNCGLGLFFCRTVVDQHGGQIWAENTLSEGARFTFELPVDRRTVRRTKERSELLAMERSETA